MRRISPSTYRRVTLLATVAVGAIIVTGAAVRLTGSGLGCTDWPTCEEGRLAPAEISDGPAMIEFANRTITGVVSVAVILAVLASLLRSPRRRDLTWLSLGLVAGVAAQAVLGGLVVLFELSPRLVMGHFLLSLVLLWNAVVLHHRAGRPDLAVVPAVGRSLVGLARLLFAVAALVVTTGTVVSAAGPHAGDEQAERLDVAIDVAARVHSTSVIALLGLVLATAWLVRRSGAPTAVWSGLTGLLVVLVGQGAVGYTQYFTGVPALLVLVHVLGAVVLWVAVVRFNLVLSIPDPRHGAAAEPSPRAAPQALVGASSS